MPVSGQCCWCWSKRDESVTFGQLTSSFFGALIDALIFEIKSERKSTEREKEEIAAPTVSPTTMRKRNSLDFYTKVNFWFFDPKIRPKLAFFQNAHFQHFDRSSQSAPPWRPCWCKKIKFLSCFDDRKILINNFALFELDYFQRIFSMITPCTMLVLYNKYLRDLNWVKVLIHLT